MHTITQEEQRVNKLSTSIDSFFKRMKIGKNLLLFSFRKIHGTRPIILLQYLIQLILNGGKNWYRLVRDQEPEYKTVKLAGKINVGIVFIQDRRGSGKWLAILSTDLTIIPQEIVRIYGYRWDIEVCFKVEDDENEWRHAKIT